MFEGITYTILTGETSTKKGPSIIKPMDNIEKVEVKETDADIIERLRYRFSILDDMTRAVKRGDIRSLIVSGPSGVGKSYGVETVLGKHQVMADLASDQTLKKYDIVKGSMSALGLYAKLYEYSHPKNILVFDDCDTIFQDDISLNILKAALDSSKTRRINWLSDSNLLRRENIPNSFDFHGGIIFITNMDFDKVKSVKLRPHLEALESRSLYLDLSIKDQHHKMLRIYQIVGDGMLESYNLPDNTKDDIMAYIDLNKDKMRELSLRSVLKVADLAKSFPDRWEDIADITILRKHFS
jgi:hypothetical protein